MDPVEHHTIGTSGWGSISDQSLYCYINFFARPIMNLHKEAKLNHLSFPTTNVAETAAFFEKYLGCEIVAAGESCLLKRNGFDIVLDHVAEEVPVWPKNFHFGLEVDSLDDVHTLYQEFLEDGVRMEPRSLTTRVVPGSFAAHRVAS